MNSLIQDNLKRFSSLGRIFLYLSLSFYIIGCGSKEVRVLPEVSQQSKSYEEGALWPKEAAGLFLFNDVKANKVGDIITVYISERVKAKNNTQTKTSRGSNYKMNIATGDDPTKMNLSGGDNFTGGGETTRDGSLESTLTAMVMEVYSNGNLRIDGMKEILVNDEKQVMKISGIIRPEDISRNNSIVSNDIAEMKIYYEGEGILSNNQDSRWLGDVLDWIWPF